MHNTGEICMIGITDENNEDGMRFVDMGNYYIDYSDNRVLVTTKELAEKYGHLVNVPVYVRKEGE